VQIPLDYYRILGVPTQATAEQLQQSYRDRAQQLPRHPYSEVAIVARKQLLEAAYTVLSNSEQRQAYDAATAAAAPQTQDQQDAGSDTTRLSSATHDQQLGGIEIAEHQLAGALLLLQELGEYELVLKLGTPYLRSGILDLKQHRLGSVLSEADIVLTVALAKLELGREQWRQNHYEKAAQSLQAGLELLLREGLFSDIQTEIRADLYKLRPYRILELLALPEDYPAQRHQGFALLQDMLNERRGIDGAGNDQSGLSINDFLQFMQQLRSYLTVTEQQELFENEARRPSSVATYLAVYALVAQGYVQKQPALIRRAKAMLLRLSAHQEVYLEQAACSLLLGQTTAASQSLELSHEYESLAFIREYSVDSPDLIPGLYLYVERWLQDEVFPYFRDLVTEKVDLRAYFADQQVQVYLDELTTETSTLSAQPALQQSLEIPQVAPASNSTVPTEARLVTTSRQTATGNETRATQPVATQVVDNSAMVSASSAKVASLNPSGAVTTLPDPRNAALKGKVANRAKVRRSARRSRPGHSMQQRWWQLGLILCGLLALGAVATALFIRREPRPPATVAEPLEQPLLDLDQPPLPIPTVNSLATPAASAGTAKPGATLSQEDIRQLIQSWQATKAAALGPQHANELLAKVLTGPALKEWSSRAQSAKAGSWYWQYKLNQVNVNAIKPINPNQVSAEVTVNETANYFERGRQQTDSSYTDSYRVRYTLVRQNSQWLIEEMNVL